MNSDNQFGQSAQDIKVRFAELLVPVAGVILNNSWHTMADCAVHCEETHRHMLANLNFSFIKNPQRKAKLEAIFNKTYKGSLLYRGELLLMAALLHDIGIAKTLVVNERGDSFTTSAPDHGPVGADIVREYLAGLDYTEEAMAYIHKLIKWHMLVHGKFNPTAGGLPTVWQIHAQFKANAIDLIMLGLADTQASDLKHINPKEYSERIALYHKAIYAVWLS